jgi:hypothetical protein
MGVLRALVNGQWVDVAGGNDEVFVGPDDPALSIPTAELWYDTDDTVSGLPWNQPWGRLGYAVKSGDQGGFSSAVADISGLVVTVAVVPGRVIKLTMYIYFFLTVASTYGQFYIANELNGQFQIGAHSPGSVSGTTVLTGLYVVPQGQTSLTAKGRAQCGSGNMTIQGAVAQCFLLVEDIGGN